MRAALEEKARYYARWISETEVYRANNLQRAKEYLQDESVKLVRFEMNATHKIVDI